MHQLDFLIKQSISLHDQSQRLTKLKSDSSLTLLDVSTNFKLQSVHSESRLCSVSAKATLTIKQYRSIDKSGRDAPCLITINIPCRLDELNKNMKFAFYGQIASVALGCYSGTLPEGFEQSSDAITPGLECGGGTSQNAKIVGGRAADQNTWPWLVMLAVTDSE